MNNLDQSANLSQEITGILLTNLGTPSEPTPSALRRYLKEFLSDPRVVEIPRLIWWPILNGIILRIRPRKSAALYKKIWLKEGSPLLVNTLSLAKQLQTFLNDTSSRRYVVKIGMRYGQPSLADALANFQKEGIAQIIVLPLYPQYSAATTATTFDAIAACLKKNRVIPSLRFIRDYAMHPDYIRAIADSIRNHWKENGKHYLLFSFHGLPKRCVDLGDPYQQQCLTTAKLVAQELQLENDEWQTVFQSRFGRAEWLQPYCDVSLMKLPELGIKKVDVICPGFAVDCLETLEEIAQLNRDLFLEAGGEIFHYIPALNDSEQHVALLARLIT